MVNVVITGASRGIGYGLAAEFAGRGHSVVIAARDHARVEEAVADLQAENRWRRPGGGNKL